ncbi:MFS transporter [Streptomyces sp. 71268]|uniref:MFS transporter n=1 Tax=Streptomyces sp. 71268 TaxID=3002640 RepID=UPI0023F69B84|nr:MFS transporter [Streptomyces sp. 71268]WEV29947.1 MFS transporter [Streptomyces sp. 71268]
MPALLRQGPFRRYWVGQSVSLIGDQISLLALPLAAVIILHADAAEMGWLATAQLLPALLFSLVAGSWVDRRASRRRIMIVSDLARAGLIASLPVAYAFDVLSLTQLYLTAFAVGSLTVLFDVCNATLFVALVPSTRYVEANSLINGSRSLAYVAGPSAGGFLVQMLAAPLALVADAFTYLLSARCLTRIDPVEPPPSAPAKGHFTAGLRWIMRSPVMRATFAASSTIQFFNFMFHTLFVLYVTSELGLGAGLLGIVLAVGAAGGLVGAATAGRVTRRLGIGRSAVLGYTLFSAPLLLVPLAGGPTPLVLGLLFLAELGSCVGAMIADVSVSSLQAALIPDALRARVTGAYRTLTHGVRPLGALTAGALGSTIGLRPTLWIGTAGAVLCLLWVLPSPVPHIRELPTPEAEAVAGPAAATDAPDATDAPGERGTGKGSETERGTGNGPHTETGPGTKVGPGSEAGPGAKPETQVGLGTKAGPGDRTGAAAGVGPGVAAEAMAPSEGEGSPR